MGYLRLVGLAILLALPVSAEPLEFYRLDPHAFLAPLLQIKYQPPLGGGSGSGTVTVSGDGSGTANTLAKFTAATAIQDSTVTDDGTIVTVNTASVFGASVATDNTRNFFKVTGTLPNGASAGLAGVNLQITSPATAAAQPVRAALINFAGSGSFGMTQTVALHVTNGAASSTTDFNLESTSEPSAAAIYAKSLTGDVSPAIYGQGSGCSTSDSCPGIVGKSIGNANTPNAIGGVFVASGSTGAGENISLTALLAGATSDTAILANTTTVDTALLIDNGTQTANILTARDNGAAIPSTGATASVTINNGAQLQLGNTVLTSATMTAEIQGESRSSTHSYTWSNAQVVALGASLTGDITVATLPAKTQVKNAYVVITGAAAGPATVTVSCGDAIGGTPFINYIVASDAKAAANTVYGDAAAERGTSIDVEFYNLPSYTATTLVTCHFISTVANLDTVTGSTGRVILETALLP